MSDRDLSPEDRGREVANGYAACLLNKRATGVRLALAHPLDDEVDHALLKMTVPDCLLGAELRMPPSLLRGALYRAMYVRRFGRSAPAAVTLSSAAVHPAATLREFGDCVVASDPSDSRVLVLSSPASVAEARALVALRPALSGCISPTSQIHLSRSVLQAVLAESAYRAATSSVVKN